MTTQKIDPKDPLFKKMIQNRFRAFIFAVPSFIVLMCIIISLDLAFELEVALLFCCIFFGNGVAYFFYAGDLEKQWKKEQQKNSQQA